MSKKRFFSGTPLCIHPSFVDTYATITAADESRMMSCSDPADFSSIARSLISSSKSDGVHLVGISGGLRRRPEMSVFPGYDEWLAEIASSNDDSSVSLRAIVVNTGGGEFSGAIEFANEIRRLDKIKPVIAYSRDMSASGGSIIISGARKSFASEGTQLGALGVISFHYGWKGEIVQAISSGWMKEAMGEGKIKDGGRVEKELRDHINESAEIMKRTVLAGRNVSEELFESGRLVQGQAAVEAGLVDEIMDYSEFLARLKAGDLLETEEVDMGKEAEQEEKKVVNEEEGTISVPKSFFNGLMSMNVFGGSKKEPQQEAPVSTKTNDGSDWLEQQLAKANSSSKAGTLLKGLLSSHGLSEEQVNEASPGLLAYAEQVCMSAGNEATRDAAMAGLERTVATVAQATLKGNGASKADLERPLSYTGGGQRAQDVKTRGGQMSASQAAAQRATERAKISYQAKVAAAGGNVPVLEWSRPGEVELEERFKDHFGEAS